MKLRTAYLLITAIFLSFNVVQAANCDQMLPYIDFVKEEVTAALNTNDLNRSKYHTYKALNGIEKSRNQMDRCGCQEANKLILEGLASLKSGAKLKSVDRLHGHLREALDDISLGINEYEKFAMNLGQLKMENSVSGVENINEYNDEFLALDHEDKARIDILVENYNESLRNVIKTQECLQAREFIEKMLRETRGTLKRPLTDLKRYYHQESLKVTESAMEQLEGCVQ